MAHVYKMDVQLIHSVNHVIDHVELVYVYNVSQPQEESYQFHNINVSVNKEHFKVKNNVFLVQLVVQDVLIPLFVKYVQYLPQEIAMELVHVLKLSFLLSNQSDSVKNVTIFV